ncbi:Cullin-4 [Grifola frondosa]|uniref:Cullin-4 n=1 Tax=Grifola frondosa TaxID=5627 RepID=A0A1C7MWN6_GRIFR|nr:Cullin-4 [Grifola frondosa]
MTDVFTLLTLPKVSSAFTALPSSAISVTEPGSRATSGGRRPDSRGLIVRVLGLPIKPAVESRGDSDFALVRRCVRVLLTKDGDDKLPATYEQIYRTCKSVVCDHGKGEGLYENVKLELEKCVGALASSLLRDGRGSVSWLIPFIESCAWFEKQVGFLQSILTYLDGFFVFHRKDLPKHTRFFKTPQIVQKMQTGIQDWIEWERINRLPHELRDIIPILIDHLITHGQYTVLFETHFIDLTHSFYTEESTARAEALKDNARGFLSHCEARRTEEIQRAKDALPQQSWSVVIDTTDRALLKGRLDWLAKEALGPLMNAKNDASLAKMYMLFARVDGLQVLRETFKNHIQNTVKNIVKDVEHDDEMVYRLLDFKAFADQLVSTAFVDDVADFRTDASKSLASPSLPSTSALPPALNDTPKKKPNKEFSYALIDAFQTGFKARRNKPAEMIAKYLDKAMRRGQKGKKDEDFQAELDAALGLYRFTDDKDVFRTFYHRALAKRLLLERSASDDFEKAMLKRLKEQYDPEFGMGDHMFNDLALSRETMREYTEYRSRLLAFCCTEVRCRSPPFMQDDLTKYTTFYKNKHKGHKLDWDHALGTATLKAQFKIGEKELSVSLYQAVVLLLFNDSEEISYNDVKMQTGLDESELRRTLQSLACGKKRVLRKHPAGKDINDTDIFYFNADFTDPRYQVHINSIQVKETLEESKRTQTSIEGDRKHALDAAIVRVMKAKKELSYEQLKAATIDAVKNHFVPDVSTIKQRIQGLVEQEYLRRDEDDMNKYIYVA